MARRFVLPSVLALALACPVWAQQQPTPSQSSSPSQQQPDQSSASQQQPAPDAPQDQQSTDSTQTKKKSRLKRMIDRGKPDCVSVGTTWCRDEQKSAADKSPNEPAPANQVPANQAPPRSDNEAPGTSSSRDTQIDLSPPAGGDVGAPGAADDVTEMHPWDPHKAAKDVEVGNFYFKRENYRAAESRYREALQYKPNDAEATFRLAESLDRQHRNADAITQYQAYLKILPSGDYAKQAEEAITRLKKAPAEPENSAKR